MRIPTFLAIASAALLLPMTKAGAAAFVPPWGGDPLSTTQIHTFTTDSLTPVPETLANAYGTPTTEIVINPNNSDGWQDPALGAASSTRVPGEGAWDLGSDGSITITIPIAPAGDFTPKFLDIGIDVVYEAGLASGPSLTLVEDTPLVLTMQDSFVEVISPRLWFRTVWQASFEEFTSDTLTVVFSSPSDNTSIIDSIAIYTVIPEPGAAALAMLGGVWLLAGRRRGGR